jgi:hypothetical protein
MNIHAIDKLLTEMDNKQAALELRIKEHLAFRQKALFTYAVVQTTLVLGIAGVFVKIVSMVWR